MCIGNINLLETLAMLKESEELDKIGFKKYLEQFIRKDGTITYRKKIYNFEELYNKLIVIENLRVMPEDFIHKK